MPGKSRKAEGHTREAQEEHRKEGEDLDRAARELHKKMTAEERKGPAKGAAKKAHEQKGGKPAASELRGAKWIESVDDHEDHHGQSLATRNHDVIMRWAEERKAQPATVGGTEHEGRPGVLRFDFPGYGGGLKAISWEEWFRTFDGRDLTFLYQEHLKNGNQSNFFKTTSPNREDG